MRTRKDAYSASVALGLLSGWGGGAAPLCHQTDTKRGKLPPPRHTRITDLGAGEYYYGYDASPNFGLLPQPRLHRINYSTQISQCERARLLYQNGKLNVSGTAYYSAANAIMGPVGRRPRPNTSGNYHATALADGQQFDLGAFDPPTHTAMRWASPKTATSSASRW